MPAMEGYFGVMHFLDNCAVCSSSPVCTMPQRVTVGCNAFLRSQMCGGAECYHAPSDSAPDIGSTAFAVAASTTMGEEVFTL